MNRLTDSETSERLRSLERVPFGRGGVYEAPHESLKLEGPATGPSSFNV